MEVNTTSEKVNEIKQDVLRIIENTDYSIHRLRSTVQYGLQQLCEDALKTETVDEEGGPFSKEDFHTVLVSEVEKWIEDIHPIQASVEQLLQWITISINEGLKKRLEKLVISNEIKRRQVQNQTASQNKKPPHEEAIGHTPANFFLPALATPCSLVSGPSVLTWRTHLSDETSRVTALSTKSAASHMLQMPTYRDTKVTKFRRTTIQQMLQQEAEKEREEQSRLRRMGVTLDMSSQSLIVQPPVKHPISIATRKRRDRLRKWREMSMKDLKLRNNAAVLNRIESRVEVHTNPHKRSETRNTLKPNPPLASEKAPKLTLPPLPAFVSLTCRKPVDNHHSKNDRLLSDAESTEREDDPRKRTHLPNVRNGKDNITNVRKEIEKNSENDEPKQLFPIRKNENKQKKPPWNFNISPERKKPHNKVTTNKNNVSKSGGTQGEKDSPIPKSSKGASFLAKKQSVRMIQTRAPTATKTKSYPTSPVRRQRAAMFKINSNCSGDFSDSDSYSSELDLLKGSTSQLSVGERSCSSNQSKNDGDSVDFQGFDLHQNSAELDLLTPDKNDEDFDQVMKKKEMELMALEQKLEKCWGESMQKKSSEYLSKGYSANQLGQLRDKTLQRTERVRKLLQNDDVFSESKSLHREDVPCTQSSVFVRNTVSDLLRAGRNNSKGGSTETHNNQGIEAHEKMQYNAPIHKREDLRTRLLDASIVENNPDLTNVSVPTWVSLSEKKNNVRILSSKSCDDKKSKPATLNRVNPTLADLRSDDYNTEGTNSVKNKNCLPNVHHSNKTKHTGDTKNEENEKAFKSTYRSLNTSKGNNAPNQNWTTTYGTKSEICKGRNMPKKKIPYRLNHSPSFNIKIGKKVLYGHRKGSACDKINSSKEGQVNCVSKKKQTSNKEGKPKRTGFFAKLRCKALRKSSSCSLPSPTKRSDDDSVDSSEPNIQQDLRSIKRKVSRFVNAC